MLADVISGAAGGKEDGFEGVARITVIIAYPVPFKAVL
jgi:hypothetical protein